MSNDNPPINYGKIGLTLLSKSKRKLSYKFKMINETDLQATLLFNMGSFTGDVYLDNIVIRQELTTQVVSEIPPAEFSLLQNYPNPFNPVTTIKFSIPAAGMQKPSPQHVNLVVLDILGRKIQTPVNEKLSAGNYEVRFDAEGMPSGVYFYRLTYGDYSITKKMILIR